MERRNVWETENPFVQAITHEGKVVLRVFERSGASPVIVELDASGALGLSVDLANKVRVLVERGEAK